MLSLICGTLPPRCKNKKDKKKNIELTGSNWIVRSVRIKASEVKTNTLGPLPYNLKWSKSLVKRLITVGIKQLYSITRIGKFSWGRRYANLLHLYLT